MYRRRHGAVNKRDQRNSHRVSHLDHVLAIINRTPPELVDRYLRHWGGVTFGLEEPLHRLGFPIRIRGWIASQWPDPTSEEHLQLIWLAYVLHGLAPGDTALTLESFSAAIGDELDLGRAA